MTRLTVAMTGILAALMGTTARADPADDAIGMWLNPANGGHVEMARCEEKLCAKIVSIPNNDPPDGPKTDKRNPDETKRGTRGGRRNRRSAQRRGDIVAIADKFGCVFVGPPLQCQLNAAGNAA